MKKYIIIGFISAFLLLAAVLIILSCAAEGAPAYVGTWVYIDTIEGRKAELIVKESSFEYRGYQEVVFDLESRGERQEYIWLTGFKGSLAESDGVFSVTVSNGYQYPYGWFDYTDEDWPGLMYYIYYFFDVYANYAEASFSLSYSISGNELTLSLAGVVPDEVVFTKQ